MGKELNTEVEKENMGGENHVHETKERSEKEYKDMINRLSRIEGQIRGIKGMVEKNVYCTDILVQVAAVYCSIPSSPFYSYYVPNFQTSVTSSAFSVY